MKHGVAKPFPLEQEYEKPTGVTPQDVAQLRKWVQTQPHLPGDHITDLDLILAYHCCDKSKEVAKQLLDLNLTVRTMFAIFKDRRYDDKADNAMRTFLMHCLPVRSCDGYACYYGALMDANPKKFIWRDIARTCFMILDLCQYEEGTWPGIMVFVDLKGMAIGHLAQLDVQTLQEIFYYVQEAFLLKLKSVHFLNAPSFMSKLMLLFKPFLKKELNDLIYIHEIGSRSLEKFYPMQALPALEDFPKFRDEVIERVRLNKEFFLEENKKRVVESLRPGKPKSVSDIFGGVTGSFKKLELD